MKGEDFVGIILLGIIVFGTVYGCNAGFENNNKFKLEKLRIERNCPEIKENQ